MYLNSRMNYFHCVTELKSVNYAGRIHLQNCCIDRDVPYAWSEGVHLSFKIRFISCISMHECRVMNLNEKTARQTHNNLNSSFFFWRDLQVFGTLATRERQEIIYLTVECKTFNKLNRFRVKFRLQSSQQQNSLRCLKAKIFPYLIIIVFKPSLQDDEHPEVMTIHSDCQNYNSVSVQAYLKCIFLPYWRGNILYMWEDVHKPAVKPVFHTRVLFMDAESGTKLQRKKIHCTHFFQPSSSYEGVMKEVLFVTSTKKFSY